MKSLSVLRSLFRSYSSISEIAYLSVGSNKPPPSLCHHLRLCRQISTSKLLFKKKNILKDEFPVIIKPGDQKILLIDENGNSMGLSPKKIAQDKADAMGLRMVNVAEYPELEKAIGRTSNHPVYKLIKGEDLHMLQMSERDAKKHLKRISSKVLQLTSTATDHDVETKLKAAEAWLKKGDHVKVLILGRRDSIPRMHELHDVVLKRLRPLAKPAIADLSKSENRIGFTLQALDEASQPEATAEAHIHTKTEDHSARIHEAQKEFVEAAELTSMRPEYAVNKKK